MSTADETCVIVGASHGGVSAAFELRKRGWQGRILLVDSDGRLPYHRPPLSKTHLTGEKALADILLRPQKSYDDQQITLMLGNAVQRIDRKARLLVLENSKTLNYTKLILAVGARPFIPPIKGMDASNRIFTIRNAADIARIKAALAGKADPNIVIIGGGYIGLEAAASLKKLGASVTVLEREKRTLARVAAPEISRFFEALHARHGVDIHTNTQVNAIQESADAVVVTCADTQAIEADFVILGVGIRVNTTLATDAGLKTDNGIVVDDTACTSDGNIYAVGDCTYHYNPHYDRHIRLESVQNAADQAKVAAAAICGNDVVYDKIPWFWSDQYDVKFQAVGLSAGYDELVVRREADEANRLSIWYFNGNHLLAVDAVNHPKAYVLGTKFIKSGQQIDKSNLANPQIDLAPGNILVAS
ncbi:MAG: FAD-dependent oxidoreductase [Bacteroidota bacterium]